MTFRERDQEAETNHGVPTPLATEETAEPTPLTEVEADRVLAPGGQGGERLFGNGLRGLGLVLGQWRRLGRLLGCQRGGHPVVGFGLLIAFPECHAVTRKSSRFIASF